MSKMHKLSFLATEKNIHGYTLNKTDVSRSPGQKYYVPKYVYPKNKYEDYVMGKLRVLKNKISCKLY